MLVSNSFDLWQRDAFFSVAEHVQESADILESAYRSWTRVKREGISLEELDELRREVQAALGTAKWQLEEFEKAVRVSYGGCHDHNRVVRHQQFVVAIESQISRVEDALREALNEGGKEPLRWVNLNEDERDDLAMFLSGSCGSSSFSNNSTESESLSKKKDADYPTCSSSSSMGTNMHTRGLNSVKNDTVIDIGQPNCGTEVSARDASGRRTDLSCEPDKSFSAKRTRVSPESGTLRVMIPNENGEMKILLPTYEDTPKVKGFRASTYFQVRGMSCMNKLCGGRMQSSRLFQSPLRLVVILMLSSFLLVPYFLHSS